MSNRRRLARERLEYYLVYLILAYRRLLLIVGLLLLVFAIANIFLNEIAGFAALFPAIFLLLLGNCYNVVVYTAQLVALIATLWRQEDQTLPHRKQYKKGCIMQTNTQDEIRSTLQKFQDGYTAREVGRLDDFMQLFAPNDEIEMIGIGAAKRAATEWFEGQSRIREIVGNDWLCVWMWMAVVLFLVIYSLGEVSDPLLLAQMNQRLDPDVRATILSMVGQVESVGQTVGGLLVGFLANLFTVLLALLAVSGLLIPVLGFIHRSNSLVDNQD